MGKNSSLQAPEDSLMLIICLLGHKGHVTAVAEVPCRVPHSNNQQTENPCFEPT